MSPEVLSVISLSAKSIAEKIIVPKIESLCTKIGQEYNKIMIPRAEHFQEYFVRSYKKFNSANLLAMRNSQKELKDIYIPLSLHIQRINSEQTNNYPLLIDGYPKKLLDKFQKIIIIDSAGMGKSTLSKIMFLSLIDTDLSRIPIFIELRRLNQKKTIIEEICEQLNAINKNVDRDLLLDFIASGDFIFFFDGFDEIALEDKNFVVADIQSFIHKAYNNYYVLTSRPEESLSGFGDFQSFSIEPLKNKEAYNLLRKYDSQGEISKILIEKIKLPENSAINEFLTNPLLVSMLFSAFEYKQTIPLKKHLFYGQVFDALFNNHDLSKGGGYIHEKRSKLSIDDFERILRYVGYECVKRHKTEYNKDELLHIIRQARSYQYSLSFSESDYLSDLLSSVALFHKEGLYYRWCHKSLSEYFAARFIYLDSKNNQDNILNAVYDSKQIESFSNLIDIYYDIDPFSFRRVMLKRFLNDYLDYCTADGNDFELYQKLLGRDAFVILSNKSADHKLNLNDQIKDLFNMDSVPLWQSLSERKFTDKLNLYVLQVHKREYTLFNLFLLLLSRKQCPLIKNNRNNDIDISLLKAEYVYYVSKDSISKYSRELCDAMISSCGRINYFIPIDEAKKEILLIKKELSSNDKESLISGI